MDKYRGRDQEVGTYPARLADDSGISQRPQVLLCSDKCYNYVHILSICNELNNCNMWCKYIQPSSPGRKIRDTYFLVIPWTM